MTAGLSLKPKIKVKHEVMRDARKSYFAVGDSMSKYSEGSEQISIQRS